MEQGRRQRLAILGSTGSIGTQTLDVVRAWPGHFEVEMLAAAENWQLLARQAGEFLPDCVVIANEEHYRALSEAIAHLPVKVYTGSDAAAQSVCSSGVDTVVSAMVGFAGLASTLAAVQAGKKVALANKETLVVAGELIMGEARRCQAPVLPVDSEHSAIFQCLVGEHSPLRRIILTASGGAFRDVPVERLGEMTAADALKHPSWNMGPKITVDCATMMNKGFEAIEARWLFDLRPEQIDVAVHPQSIVHSFVEFEDGALKAQMGTPDMRLPIQYALTFPYRLPLEGAEGRAKAERYDPVTGGDLTFARPDAEKYPCLTLACEAMRSGGGSPCVLNAANEVAVAEFLAGNIGFTDIYKGVARTLGVIPGGAPRNLEEYTALDGEARRRTAEILKQLTT